MLASAVNATTELSSSIMPVDTFREVKCPMERSLYHAFIPIEVWSVDAKAFSTVMSSQS